MIWLNWLKGGWKIMSPLELPAWVGQFGQIGVLLWMIFEVRDIRRWLNAHIEIHHPPMNRRKDDGQG